MLSKRMVLITLKAGSNLEDPAAAAPAQWSIVLPRELFNDAVLPPLAPDPARWDLVEHGIAEIDRHARLQILLCVPPSFAKIHAEHLVFEIHHVPFAPANAATAATSYIVTYAWAVSALLRVASMPVDHPARALSASRVVFPVLTLKRLFERLMTLGLDSNRVTDDCSLMTEIDSRVDGAAGDNGLLVGNIPLDSPLIDNTSAAQLQARDTWHKGAEYLTINDVVGGGNLSLLPLARFYRAVGPFENYSRRDLASDDNSFLPVCLALCGPSVPAHLGEAVFGRRLKRGCQIASLPDLFWPNGDIGSGERASADLTDLAMQAFALALGSDHEKLQAFNELFFNAVNKPVFLSLCELIDGTHGGLASVNRFFVLVQALAPALSSSKCTVGCMFKVQTEVSKFEGIITGEGTADEKIQQIVQLAQAGPASRQPAHYGSAAPSSAAGEPSGPGQDYTVLLSSVPFARISSAVTALAADYTEDWQISALLLLCNSRWAIKLVLVAGMKIPVAQGGDALQDVLHVMSKGKSGVSDVGQGGRKFDKLHLVLDESIKAACGLEYIAGSLNLPQDEVVKLGAGKYADVHWEKLVGAVLQVQKKRMPDHINDPAWKFHIVDLYPLILSVAGSILQALGHGPADAYGSFSSVFSHFIECFNEAQFAPTSSIGDQDGFKHSLLYADQNGAFALLDAALIAGQRSREAILHKDARVCDMDTAMFFVPPGSPYFSSLEANKDARLATAQFSLNFSVLLGGPSAAPSRFAMPPGYDGKSSTPESAAKAADSGNKRSKKGGSAQERQHKAAKSDKAKGGKSSGKGSPGPQTAKGAGKGKGKGKGGNDGGGKAVGSTARFVDSTSHEGFLCTRAFIPKPPNLTNAPSTPALKVNSSKARDLLVNEFGFTTAQSEQACLPVLMDLGGYAGISTKRAGFCPCPTAAGHENHGSGAHWVPDGLKQRMIDEFAVGN